MVSPIRSGLILTISLKELVTRVPPSTGSSAAGAEASGAALSAGAVLSAVALGVFAVLFVLQPVNKIPMSDTISKIDHQFLFFVIPFTPPFLSTGSRFTWILDLKLSCSGMQSALLLSLCSLRLLFAPLGS
ncbi:hypothetical protein D3C75_926360 [compost metagenome]